MKNSNFFLFFLCLIKILTASSSFAQTLSGSNNEQITGTWTFQNGMELHGLKRFVTNNLSSVRVTNTSLNCSLEIGIAEANTNYHPFASTGDIIIRRMGGVLQAGKLIIGNGFTLNHPNNTLAATGIMGANTGGGVWAHNNGNVRIGIYKTQMPTEQLVVDGNGLFNGNLNVSSLIKSKSIVANGIIEAKEIKISTAPGADFVFDSSYQLRDLQEVEAFIRENKHLPEIPSAKEMEANGVNLAEMNKLLLQKIEELTYIQ